MAIFVLGLGGLLSLATILLAASDSFPWTTILGRAAFGAAVGLVIAINYWQGVSWVRFVVTRAIFGFDGTLSIRLMRFLDDANRRGASAR
jgi:hypothetical protein